MLLIFTLEYFPEGKLREHVFPNNLANNFITYVTPVSKKTALTVFTPVLVPRQPSVKNCHNSLYSYPIS